ncbi:glycosyltransferase [Alloalcanivorax marinus]|uniref:glycosyltransferase n=1 Tax=Alloalcanivorax marinus TaxID=1177169 RepID=UPI001933FD19|nr:glycosyltransferase [Alloalcanivorax marinus]MBL7249467.1 glycosyltransferase [Alloalcanivorax marinus]
MRKRVLFNFVPVSIGGGLQNTLSFLSTAKKSSKLNFDFVVACRHHSKIESYCRDNEIPYVSVGNGLLHRLCFEVFGGAFLAKRLKVDLVFSLFGGSPYLMYGVAKKVCGFAYSNIIESDVDFWWFCSGKDKLVKRSIDFFRLRSFGNADFVIMETDRLARLAKEGAFKDTQVSVVHMAPSSLIVHKDVDRIKEISEKDEFSILYLCGPHKNKRIKSLAAVFQCLHADGFLVSLITTLPENCSVFMEVKDEFRRLGVEHALKNIGPISPDSLNEVFDAVDGVVNVALLESFSNNWVEAWAASLPLFSTDAGWAKDSCGDAAVYINVDKPEDAANRIRGTYSSISEMEKIVGSGKEMLSFLPTPEEKFERYRMIIEKCLKETA